VGITLQASLDAPCAPEQMFPFVEDLAQYPNWLTIVAAADGVAPVWDIELRGKLGPFSRSKRLRMVRVTHEDPTRVVFERHEGDGREHAPWKLQANVAPIDSGCRLEVELRYDGALWGTVIEHLLQDEIERAKARLLTLVSESP
jgi:carbon monoxide dehydrogenase subunit G